MVAKFDYPKDCAGILVPVKYGDHVYSFLLDTGASCITFDQRFQQSLGKPIRRVQLLKWEDDQRVECDMYEPPAAFISQLDIRRAGAVMCQDLSLLSSAAGHDIAGIVGMSFLKDHVVRIDTAKGSLWLLKPDGGLHPDWGDPVPLTKRFGLRAVSAAVGELPPMPFVIDTGCAGSDGGLLASHAIDALLAAQQGTRGREVARVVSGGVGAPARSIRSVELRLAEVTYPAMSFSEARSISVLGLGFLSRHIVTLDFPNHRMYLRAQDQPSVLPRQYLSGLLLRRDGQQLVVEAVRARGPAAKAELQKGDVLLSIDDQDVAHLEAWQAARLLIADHAQQVTLDIRRSGQTRRVTFTLVDPASQSDSDATLAAPPQAPR